MAPQCSAPRAGRPGYQETIGFSFVEERWEHELAGNADPIRVLQPDRQPVGGDAFQPDGQSDRGTAGQINRARRYACVVRRRARIPPRCLGARRQRSVAGVAQLRRVAGLAWARRCAAMGQQGARGRLLRREGRHRGAARAAPRHFVPVEHPALHPAAAGARRAGRAGHRLRRRTASALAPGLRAAVGAHAVRTRSRRRAARDVPAVRRCRASSRYSATSRWWPASRSAMLR